METKTERNCRVQKLYGELMAEGKHGHYETMFRIVRLEVEAEREACAIACREVAQKQGTLARQFAAIDCESAIRARSNAKVSERRAAGAESARLPGYAGDNKGEKK